MIKLSIYGAGGAGKEIITTINAINSENQQLKVIGFFEDDPLVKIPFEYMRLGGLRELVSAQQRQCLIIAIADIPIKKRLLEDLATSKVRYINVIHPTALYDDSSRIGSDCYIGPYTVLGPNTKIGDHVYIGSHCSIGHDTVIANGCSIMPGSHIAGNVSLGNFTFVGAGAKLLQGLVIDKDCTIGAGAVVTRHVGSGMKMVGIPAKSLNNS